MLEVDEQVKFIAFEVLLMLCAKAAPVGCWDYSICLEDKTSKPAAGHALDMPCCGHAFHRKGITKWFSWRFTYPMCRCNLCRYLDLIVQRFLSHFTDQDF
jgi:hypothetical protein